MIYSSYLRMQWFVDTYISFASGICVLDVGSYDLNGSFRDLFSHSKCKYVGLDIESGPNVDLVLNRPYDWSMLQTDYFDVVISGNVLEHVEFPWITFSEMARILKPGGLLCVVVPNGFREHRYPVDCWRFFTDGVIAFARMAHLEVLHAHTNAGPTSNHLDWFSVWGRSAETMLVARKSYGGVPPPLVYHSYQLTIPNQSQYLGGFVTYNQLSLFNKFILLMRALKSFVHP